MIQQEVDILVHDYAREGRAGAEDDVIALGAALIEAVDRGAGGVLAKFLFGGEEEDA